MLRLPVIMHYKLIKLNPQKNVLLTLTHCCADVAKALSQSYVYVWAVWVTSQTVYVYVCVSD